MITNTYLLFYGENYYAIGGLGDYKGSFPTIEDCIEYHKQGQLPRPKYCCGVWAHIAHKDTMEIQQEFDGIGRWERVNKDGE